MQSSICKVRLFRVSANYWDPEYFGLTVRNSSAMQLLFTGDDCRSCKKQSQTPEMPEIPKLYGHLIYNLFYNFRWRKYADLRSFLRRYEKSLSATEVPGKPGNTTKNETIRRYANHDKNTFHLPQR